jgi:phospholipid/cholesterol/gamma-HCH transport system substrate-binding protein
MSPAAKVGAVMLVALGVLGFFILRIEDLNLGRSATSRDVVVTFDNVAGLDEESPVRIAGVRKGHVESIRVLPDGRAEVTLEVDDDIPIHRNATATVANLGLLGDKYIELNPGSPAAPVVPKDQVVMIRGGDSASIDEVTNQVSQIAEDVKAITASMRTVMSGPAGQQRLEEIVENVRGITEEVRALIAANRENVDATLENTRAITAHLRQEIPELAAALERIADQIGGTVGENREDMRAVMQNLRTLSADLRTTSDNLGAITGQVRSGEGTVGKLLYDDEAHERLTTALSSVESGVTELKNTLGRVNKLQMDLGIRADYLAGLSEREVEGVETRNGNTRSTVMLRLVPNPERNRFYHVELADDPRGRRRDRVEVNTYTNANTGEATTIVTETTKFDRDFLITAQAGWVLDDLALRVGLIDSTGGIGADYTLNDRIRITGEAFDFGKRRDDLPHLRLLGEYTFRKEKGHTPRLFFSTGIDNALNDTAFVFGGGLRWEDQDLKYLLGSIPLGN